MKRGALIVLEGCDRAGKSTQAKNLVKSLLSSGKEAKYINFPDRTTKMGALIDQYLTNKQEMTDQEIHLLFTQNRWEAKLKMEKLLNDGVNLIVDRYSYSGVAYSVAKGLKFDWCRAPEAGLLKPDLVIYLNLSIEAIINRGGFGAERYETDKFQEKVGKCFDQLFEDEYWIRIEADKSEEALLKELEGHVNCVVAAVQNKPLASLW